MRCPVAQATAVCDRQGWNLVQVRFYTGIPEPPDPRHAFWTNKLAHLGRHCVYTFRRPTHDAREVLFRGRQ